MRITHTRIGFVLLALLLTTSCDASLLSCSSAEERGQTLGTWLWASIALSFFEEDAAREIPNRWATIDAFLRTQDGYRQNVLLATRQSEYLYINMGIWNSRNELESAYADPAFAERLGEGTVHNGVYEVAAHRGDVRDTDAGHFLLVIPISGAQDDNVEEQFRTHGEWFGQQRGFVGTVLLRRVSGEADPYVLIARWTSAEAMNELVGRTEFVDHISGLEGRVGAYIQAQP